MRRLSLPSSARGPSPRPLRRTKGQPGGRGALSVLPRHLDSWRPPSGLGSPEGGGKGWGQGLAYLGSTPKPLTLHLG